MVGGMSISFENVPFTFTFHKFTPGIPKEKQRRKHRLMHKLFWAQVTVILPFLPSSPETINESKVS